MSTLAASKGCELRAKATNLFALGMCANILGSAGATQCRDDAKSGLAAAQDLCKAQAAERTAACATLGQDPYDPVIKPGDFSTHITNPLLPMVPGTTFTYGVPDGLDILVVSDQVRTIEGVDCVVVHDTVALTDGSKEVTDDYFAQDRAGNVWYFGEDTSDANAAGHIVSKAGTWHAGTRGAKPGIIMPADPKVGDTYRQEFLLGTAEDAAEVVALGQSASVPYGSFNDAVKTREFTGLEPGAAENKYYVKGIGNVLVVDLVTGERDELISVAHQ